jgi:hypothetical protein
MIGIGSTRAEIFKDPRDDSVFINRGRGAAAGVEGYDGCESRR